jgi:hypothetical protein
MNSAGEEDDSEEQVDCGEEESSMSFHGQARSRATTWRRMLCSRCILADLLPGFIGAELTAVNVMIEILLWGRLGVHGLDRLPLRVFSIGKYAFQKENRDPTETGVGQDRGHLESHDSHLFKSQQQSVSPKFSFGSTHEHKTIEQTKVVILIY